jgi:chromosome segregation ATPase
LVTQLVIVAMAAAKAREKLDAAEKRILAQERSFEDRLNHMDATWRANCSKLDDAFERRIAELTSQMSTGEGRREAVTAGLAQTREEVANFRGAAETQIAGLTAGVEGVKREVAEINRRLSEIAKELFSAGGRRRTRTTE